MLNNLKYFSTVKVTVSALNKYSAMGLVFTGIATIVWFNDSVLGPPFMWYHVPETVAFLLFGACISTWLKEWGVSELNSVIIIFAVYVSDIILTNLVFGITPWGVVIVASPLLLGYAAHRLPRF
jgi:hypothetical protein